MRPSGAETGPLTAPTIPSVATQNRMSGSHIRPVTGVRYARTYPAGTAVKLLLRHQYSKRPGQSGELPHYYLLSERTTSITEGDP